MLVQMGDETMPHPPHHPQHCARSLLRTLLPSTATRPAEADPVARVGRLARLIGPVFLSRAAGSGTEAAIGNWPLTSGDLLSTGVGGSAEVEIGSTLVRLAAESVLALLRVDDRQLVLRLREGSLIIRCRSAEMARQTAIECAGLRFEPCDAGRYGLQVAEGVTGTAWEGVLRCSAAGRSHLIAAGQSIRLGGDGEAEGQTRAMDSDELARWSPAGETGPGASDEFRHVSPELTGAADLAAHGDWYESPAYGAVWFPRDLAADWAPYRAGHWAWLAPWGWTWIGAEPWAFAPFHYGRWASFRGAWGWLPGCRGQRPVYAPALVAWSDPVEAGRPPCGSQPATDWLPLGPHEAYLPTYHCSDAYVRQINAAHVSDGSETDEKGRQLLTTLWARARQPLRSPAGAARA
jgi:hypothetical protein